MREVGINDFQRYYRSVVEDRLGVIEWSTLVDRLTIHETSFKRHPASFRLVEDVVIPKLIEQSAEMPRLSVWSAGCASGEETYSLAIAINRALRNHTDEYYFGVTGTDISAQSVKLARAGRYSLAAVANSLGAGALEEYFEGEGDDHVRVKSSLKRRVCFSTLNLVSEAPYPLSTMDIIYCQNVLIYFPLQLRESLLKRFMSYLKPGGFLILGVGEMTGWSMDGLKRVDYPDTLAYQRTTE